MYLKLTLLLLVFMNSKTSPNYTVIDWQEANEIKSAETTKFLFNLECNLSAVYLIKDASYLVMPIGPFGKALITSEKRLLDKWIDDCYFPTDEDVNDFYSKNKNKIESLPNNREEQKNDLYVALPDMQYSESKPEYIDEAYKILKKKRKFQALKLNFVVLVGDYLIAKDPLKETFWGLLESKQLLNPIRTLVLVKKHNGEERYYKLEENIDGKWGYIGMQAMLNFYNQFWLRPNEINTIRKLR